jgi:hypothetical protein
MHWRMRGAFSPVVHKSETSDARVAGIYKENSFAAAVVL